jgi:dolichol-phosphate mannosyltransferase
LLLHLLVLGCLYLAAGLPFVMAQTISTALAMVSNFLVNNAITFRSRRLRGAALAPGLAAYVFICGFGAIVNIQSAEYLFESRIPWWFAGVAGALIGAVWNYAVSTQIVWTWLPVILGNRHRSNPDPGK